MAHLGLDAGGLLWRGDGAAVELLVQLGQPGLDCGHLALVPVLTSGVVETLQADAFNLGDRDGPGGFGVHHRGAFGQVRPTVFELSTNDILVL